MVPSANSQRDYTDAMAAFWQGDYVRAVRLFNQVAAAEPQDTAVKLLLALAQKQAGQLLEARQTYNTILQTASDPDELESARKGLEELLQMAPELADLPDSPEADKFRSPDEFARGSDAFSEEAFLLPIPSCSSRRWGKRRRIPLLRIPFHWRQTALAAISWEKRFGDPLETGLQMPEADPLGLSHPMPTHSWVTPPATSRRVGSEEGGPQTDPVVEDDFAFLNEFDREHLEALEGDSDSITQLAGDADFPDEMGFSLPGLEEEEGDPWKKACRPNWLPP